MRKFLFNYKIILLNILNIDLIELLLVYIEHSFFMESINFQFQSLFAETTPDAYLKTRCVAMTTRYRSLYGIGNPIFR